MKREERRKIAEDKAKFSKLSQPIEYLTVQTTSMQGDICHLCKAQWSNFHNCRYGYSEGTFPRNNSLGVKMMGGEPIRIAMAGDRFIRATLIGYQEGHKVVEHKDGKLEVLNKQVETF